MLKKYAHILILIALVVLAACDSGGNGPATSTDELIQKGWEAFEAGRYSDAIQQFVTVLNLEEKGSVEASMGLGWARAFQRNFDGAINAWLTGRADDNDNADINAGLCLVYHVKSDFANAITAGSQALLTSPDYVFEHKTDITAQTIRLTMAQSYYATGDFSSAASQMDAAFPEAAPHSRDPETLLNQIMVALGVK